ncbi:methyltransferase domain-containing protein [Dactylosporangium sucinum]|uniref:Methyltransferase n=1 Tax=Dactylosporangium sucinum TaxID=1424081 RepID=A0A917TCI8_9ACTN|nr:class I SAM-dependent methyltransferase [Dactylosporangium sucinum]GGM17630.1 methyltransferase [Dactylosporangium sucinum]
MDVDDLLSEAGRQALAAAGTITDAHRHPLRAAEHLRAQGIAPALAAAALTQAELRRKAVTKFGADAAVMLFTRAGLEQATRAAVATRRARRLAVAGVTSVADLGCGIGADTIAFARAGLRVRAVDADPTTARIAQANAAALGLPADVTHGDAVTTDLTGVDAVFCDPARRTKGGQRVFDPRAYEPPWDFVAALPARVPRTVLKLAPGIDHDLLPEHAEGEWVSIDGDLVEAAAWCGPLAETPRRATLISTATPAVHELTGTGGEQAPVDRPKRFLHDPDAAVIRAHLVAEFAGTIGGTLADPTIAYTYTDEPATTPFARTYEVLEHLPVALKRLRAALRDLDAGPLTILKRGSALDVEELRKSLKLTGGSPATIALTRIGRAPAVLLLRTAAGPAAAAG